MKRFFLPLLFAIALAAPAVAGTVMTQGSPCSCVCVKLGDKQFCVCLCSPPVDAHQ